MCKWGKDKKVKVIHTNKIVKVDKCLAQLIKILNQYGIETLACCCGHGKTSHSSIRINSKNIELLPLGEDLAVHLKFPYKEKEENNESK